MVKYTNSVVMRLRGKPCGKEYMKALHVFLNEEAFGALSQTIPIIGILVFIFRSRTTSNAVAEFAPPFDIMCNRIRGFSFELAPSACGLPHSSNTLQTASAAGFMARC